MLRHYAFFNFAKHYTLSRHIAKTFEVDDSVMQEFHHFLDAQKVPYTEAELVENNDWTSANIKSELFIAEFGQQEGLRVRAEADPQIVESLKYLPKAKDLADNAKKVIAEHNSARAVNQQKIPARKSPPGGGLFL